MGFVHNFKTIFHEKAAAQNQKKVKFRLYPILVFFQISPELQKLGDSIKSYFIQCSVWIIRIFSSYPLTKHKNNKDVEEA